jgi:integrase
MRDRGSGSIYKRPGSRFYQIKFSKDGRVYRESTSTDKITEAKAILQDRLNKLQHGTYSPEAKKVRVSELIDAVLLDYRNNGKKSVEFVEMRWKSHLQPVFGHMLAAHVTSDDIEQYKQKRLSEGASNATINRELAILKRGFHLGMQSTPPKVQRVPHFAMLAENNVRIGFVEPAQYNKLIAATAKRGLWLRAMFECGFTYGWRKSELLNLKVRQVDLLNRTITLDVGSTKNKKGRTVHMTESVYQLLSACAIRKQPEDYVFTRDDGKRKRRIKDFRGTWEAVTAEAGVPNLLFHDLRRTGVRGLVRSGISEHVAMKISGHKTRSVFDRYDIVSDADLRDAARKLEIARKAQIELAAAQAQQSEQQPISTQNGTQFVILESASKSN